MKSSEHWPPHKTFKICDCLFYSETSDYVTTRTEHYCSPSFSGAIIFKWMGFS